MLAGSDCPVSTESLAKLAVPAAMKSFMDICWCCLPLFAAIIAGRDEAIERPPNPAWEAAAAIDPEAEGSAPIVMGHEGRTGFWKREMDGGCAVAEVRLTVPPAAVTAEFPLPPWLPFPSSSWEWELPLIVARGWAGDAMTKGPESGDGGIEDINQQVHSDGVQNDAIHFCR